MLLAKAAKEPRKRDGLWMVGKDEMVSPTMISLWLTSWSSQRVFLTMTSWSSVKDLYTGSWLKIYDKRVD